MTGFIGIKSGPARALSGLLLPGFFAAFGLSGCAIPGVPDTVVAKPSDASEKVPRLIRRDAAVVWNDPNLFKAVPAELQALGDQACNAVVAGQPMAAVGYHAHAVRLDGSLFPKGGFLCAAREKLAASALPLAVETAKPAEEVRTVDAAKPAEMAKPIEAFKAAEPQPKEAPAVISPPASEPAASKKEAPLDIADLDGRVRAWAGAWASKDLDAYFGFYGTQFKPVGFSDLAAWKASRRSRITGSGAITIDISSVKSTALTGRRVETRFKQRYVSSRFRGVTQKSLTWEKEAGEWRIVAERSDSDR